MPSRPLRFVILCDSPDLEAWQADCVREATGSGLAELAGVIVEPAPGTLRPHRHVLWRAFDRLFLRRHCRATRRVDMGADVCAIPVSHDAHAVIKKARPDFILHFGTGTRDSGLAQAARYGIWWFDHGDPPGFWPIHAASSVTGVTLRMSRGEGDEILNAGHFRTLPFSLAQTRDLILFGAAGWVRRACADILANGAPTCTPAPPQPVTPGRGLPTNGEMLRFLWRTLRAVVAIEIAYRFLRQRWNVGLVPAPIAVVAGLKGPERQRAALAATHWVPPARTYFLADPFGSEAHGGAIRILVEQFDWGKARGEIAATTYRDGCFGPIEPVLALPSHLSYPYVVGDGDAPAFMPENASARDLAVYAADGTRLAVLGDTALVDATPVEWGGRVWLFAGDETTSRNTDLHLFHADSLAGPWTSHPLNPVKSDIRSARPAGTPFIHAGRLYRPAQDCAAHYGSAVVINEIVTLTETRFEERPVARVEPLPDGGYAHGLHTVSAVGGQTLIDGARRVARYL